MKQLRVVLLLFVYAQVVFGQLSGPLSGTLGPGTYHIVGDISIQPSDTLTLMPGTVFHFDSLYEFYISGTLLAEGIEGDSIVFTTDTTANPDRWRGLRFNGASSSGGRLAYCLIENAHRTGSMPNNYGGGVYCTSSSPTFANCAIMRNIAERGGGVYCTNSSSSFTECTISNNSVDVFGGGVCCTDASMTTFTNCTISSNTATGTSGWGGGFFCMDSSPTFMNCTINDNTANGSMFPGGGVFCSNSSCNFIECAISGNYASATGYGGGGVSCLGSSLDFIGCNINGNSAEGDGGAIYSSESSASSLERCTISHNVSGGRGGAIYSHGSSLNLTDCIISNNHSNESGGGLYFTSYSSGEITNCTISSNSANDDGGAIVCYWCSPNFTKCTISSNSAGRDGGGVYFYQSSSVFNNCTITNNSGEAFGGGVCCRATSPTFNSTIIAFSEGEGIWFAWSPESQLKYCDIFGNSEGNITFVMDDPSNGPPGVGQLDTLNANGDSCDTSFNIFLDPMFVDTVANDFHLQDSSACIDAGDPSLLPDPDGTVVEIGAFYYPQVSASFTLSPDSLDYETVFYRHDSTLTFRIHNLTQDILCVSAIRATDTLIFHATPTSSQIPAMDSVQIELTFTPLRDISYLDSVRIAVAGLDEAQMVIVQGTGVYDCHVLDGILSGTLSTDCSPYYVAGEVTIEEDDTFMIDAGVDVIFDCHCKFIVNGLLMAMGTEQDSIKFTCDTFYTPDHWAGIRFVSAHDSCHLEYCAIEDSRAEGAWPDYNGGGVYCESSSPAFSHCSISDNWADGDGGGVYCYHESSPTFTHCTICGNSTERDAAGIYCFQSSPNLTNCLISDNSAHFEGGGLYCHFSSPILDHCAISNNSTESDGGGILLHGASSTPTFMGCIVSDNSADGLGGGLYCDEDTSPNLDSCTISGNTSDGDGGGGLYCWRSSPTLTNCSMIGNSTNSNGGGIKLYSTSTRPIFTDCIISSNSADSLGGGSYCHSSFATFTHCVFSDNMASSGAGAYCRWSTDTFTNCTITGNSVENDGGGVYCLNASSIFNSTIIAFSNDHGVYFDNSSESVLEYCDVYGNSVGAFGGNVPEGLGEISTINANGDSCDAFYNIFLDPMFVDTASSNYHLLTGSPCIDAGDFDLPLDPDSTTADIGAFYFQMNPPSPFNLLSPLNGDTVNAENVTLTWEASSDPDPQDSIVAYQIYVALDSLFTISLDTQEVRANELVWDNPEDGQTYWWRVKAFDTQGNETFSNQTWSFHYMSLTVSGQDVLVPREFALHQNYPNPFNPTTMIRYDMKHTGLVSVKVYDILGREVATLVHAIVPAGFHKVTWNAANLPSGIYVCRMEAPGFAFARKLLLIK
jgi:predicted outer membrane repeat protein